MAKAFTGTASGGWGFKGETFDLGINSGSGGIGFGLSNLNHFYGTNQPYMRVNLSLSPEEAENLAWALLEHAGAVRDRLALAEGIRQSAAGEVESLGNFEQYADDDIDGED